MVAPWLVCVEGGVHDVYQVARLRLYGHPASSDRVCLCVGGEGGGCVGGGREHARLCLYVRVHAWGACAIKAVCMRRRGGGVLAKEDEHGCNIRTCT